MTGPRLNGNNTETISIVGLDILYTDFASLPVPSGNGYTNIQNASIVTIT